MNDTRPSDLERFIQTMPDAAYDPASKKLAIRGLTEFPRELLDFADDIEILDLSHGQLTSLPADFDRLNNLRVAFFSGNDFATVPEILGECPHLEFLGLKSAHVRHLPGASLPSSLRWLTLTDNRLTELPEELGRLPHLEKLLLSGNRLTALPPSLASSRSLALLRIAANQLTVPPAELLQLPTLAWYADSGNPYSPPAPLPEPVISIPRTELEIGPRIGGSAWNTVMAATYRQQDVALKLYGGSVTSDGYPADDMAASLLAGTHPNLIPVLGRLDDDTTPGLVMRRLPASFQPLGLPPDFASVTRDTFPPQQRFTMPYTIATLSAVAAAAAHLHSRGIMHGDIYAHNVLADTTGHAYLSDLGAASIYDRSQAQHRESPDVRAFGYLIDDLLSRIDSAGSTVSALIDLRDICLSLDVATRPSFTDIIGLLAGI